MLFYEGIGFSGRTKRRDKVRTVITGSLTTEMEHDVGEVRRR